MRRSFQKHPQAAPKQRALLEERLAREGQDARLDLRADLEELAPVSGGVFSNELVDAFPVSVVTRSAGHLKETNRLQRGGKERQTRESEQPPTP